MTETSVVTGGRLSFNQSTVFLFACLFVSQQGLKLTAFHCLYLQTTTQDGHRMNL